MHKPKLILENEMHKILWYFEMQTDHVTSPRRPDLADFTILADYRWKIRAKKINKYLHLARELRKLWNMKVTVIPIVVGAFGMVPKGLERR